MREHTNTHAAQTYSLDGHFTRFWPTKLEPDQSLQCIPRVRLPPQTQHSPSAGAKPSTSGEPMCS